VVPSVHRPHGSTDPPAPQAYGWLTGPPAQLGSHRLHWLNRFTGPLVQRAHRFSGPTGPTGPTTPLKPKHKITKTVDHETVQSGSQVIFTLSVKNEGTASSSDTVISDSVPVGLHVDSADAPCTITGQLVRCAVGSLAPGQTVSYQVKATTSLPTSDTADDQLAINKVETQISLQAGETRTADHL
jgi:uncharacterized repeat protein (TIGR01451 family)